jgi:outer membrane protein assembly factor BamB
MDEVANLFPVFCFVMLVFISCDHSFKQADVEFIPVEEYVGKNVSYAERIHREAELWRTDKELKGQGRNDSTMYWRYMPKRETSNEYDIKDIIKGIEFDVSVANGIITDVSRSISTNSFISFKNYYTSKIATYSKKYGLPRCSGYENPFDKSVEEEIYLNSERIKETDYIVNCRPTWHLESESEEIDRISLNPVSPSGHEGIESFRKISITVFSDVDIDHGTGSGVSVESRWRFETRGIVQSSPAVSEGTVYIGSGDNHVYAIDRETGQEKWRFESGDGVNSSPAVAEGTVYVGSRDDHLYAIDAETGQEKWRSESGFGASPTVAGGTVYVGGSRDSYVHAIDAETGQEKWRFETGDWTLSSPTVVRETVYIGSGDSHVYGIDRETGEQEWSFETEGIVQSSPAVSGGTVYIGSGDNHVYAIDRETGKEEWSFEAGDEVDSSPAVAEGTVYVGSRDDNVYAIDAETGQEKWRYETGGDVTSSPAVAGGTVYVGSLDDHIYAIDAETGQEKWHFRAEDWIAFHPAVSEGTVYVGSHDHNVYAIDTEN